MAVLLLTPDPPKKKWKALHWWPSTFVIQFQVDDHMGPKPQGRHQTQAMAWLFIKAYKQDSHDAVSGQGRHDDILW